MTAVDLTKIGLDPVAVDQGVGVGGQKHALWRGELGGRLHRQASRPSGVGPGAIQLHLVHFQPIRKLMGELAHLFGGAVGAIVKQHQDRNVFKVDALLRGKGQKAGGEDARPHS